MMMMKMPTTRRVALLLVCLATTIMSCMASTAVHVDETHHQDDDNVPPYRRHRHRLSKEEDPKSPRGLTQSWFPSDDSNLSLLTSTTTLTTPDFASFRQDQGRRTQNDNNNNNNEQEQDSLQEIVAGTRILRLWEAYLGLALLVPEIQGDGPLTLWTPWNVPVRRDINAKTAAKLQRADRAWIVHLQDFLHLHMYKGDLKPLEIPQEGLEPEIMYTMANGQEVTIKRTPGSTRIFVNDGSPNAQDIIVLANEDAINGHAYMLDAVLIPTWMTTDLRQVVESAYTTFYSWLERIDETGVLEIDNALTVFAPVNAAFTTDVVAVLEAAEAFGSVGDIVLQHVALHGPYPSITFYDRNLDTLVGGDEREALIIRLERGNPPSVSSTVTGAVNQAAIILPDDQIGFNGLVHGIDAVLLLEVATMTTFPTDEPTDRPTDPPLPFPTSAPTVVPTADSPSSMPTINDCNVLDYVILEVPESDFLDIRNDDYSPGDVYMFDANDVFVGTQLVGESMGRCVVLEDTDNDDNIYCTMEFMFGGGTVVAHGRFDQLVAVGGTGCYQDVQGYLRLVDNEDFFGYQLVPDDTECSSSTSLFASPWTEQSSETQIAIDWDGDSQFSPGDVVVFDNNAFTTSRGEQGTLEGECMVLFDPETGTSDSDKAFCTMTFFTSAGHRVLVMGVFTEMIILSGTGCFSGVSGGIAGSRRNNGDYRYALELDSRSVSPCSTDIFGQPWTEPVGDFFVNYISQPWEPWWVDPDDDYDANTPGDVYVFLDKVITAPATGEVGRGAGRCLVVETQEYTFCNIVFEFAGGSIAVQGIFTEMSVIGASGCYQGLHGIVFGEELDDDTFTYSWDVSFAST